MSSLHFTLFGVLLVVLIHQTGAASLTEEKHTSNDKLEEVLEVDKRIDSVKKSQYDLLLEKMKSLEEKVLAARDSLDKDKQESVVDANEVDEKKDSIKTSGDKETNGRAVGGTDGVEKGKVDEKIESVADVNIITRKDKKPLAVKEKEEDDDDDDDDDDNDDDDDDNDDDDDSPLPPFKKAENSVKKIGNAAAKMTKYMNELNEAAKEVKEIKRPAKYQDNNDIALDDWLAHKFTIAEKAMAQFTDMLQTLMKLFEMDYNNNDSNAISKQTKNAKRSDILKENLNNKMKEVAGSAKYLDNMIKSLGKMFAKKK